jgi:hypothetical protein
VIADQGGLDAGRYIRTGGGNDIVFADNGPMRGHIDTGTGNDIIFVEQFDGRITTGAGHDDIDVGSFGPLHLLGGKATDIAVDRRLPEGLRPPRVRGCRRRGPEAADRSSSPPPPSTTP